jgi:hypothetical protein
LPKITAIELENFQTIGKRTTIPIRDLTLMFGPNGAGKSSIFDALDLLKLISSDDWGQDCSKLEVLLTKWSRNINGDTPSNSIGVGIQIFMDDSWGNDDLPYEIFQRIDRIHHSSISRGGDYAEGFLEKNLQFFIKFKNIGETYKDWYISELSINFEGDQVLELKQDNPDSYPVAHLHEKEWISFSEIKEITGKHKDIKFQDGTLSGRVVGRIGFESSARSWFDKRYEGDEALESEFTNLLQQVIDFFKMIITAEMKDADLVKASRTVPTIKEAISLIPGETWQGKENRERGYRLELSPLLKTLEPIINTSETHWKYMCQLVAASKTSGDDEISSDWFDLSYLERINSLLREELFIENGYQLTGEVFCAAELVDLEEYSLNDSRYYPKLVRLFLTDNHQRKLQIEDVGSGIGYVLPVLSSLVHDDISLIQQPELHLHPRLQSQLGEAIVRAIENKKYYRAFTIIETHSEHVLLKVMRLIRNAESRKDDSLNPITYDRVSVLYFEPLANGETQVKRLRLAPDGQLIDRWPGGFFNERFKDIFDE